MKMTGGVKNFLQRLGMVKYHAIFSAKGFDLETDIPHLTISDLKETLMVSCEKERHIILSSAQRFKASSEHYVYEWLRRNSLDHYFINFIQSELLDLETVSKIQLPSEELYDELEIVLPGHRKRLERAVLNLRQEMQRRSVAEKPVTQGWWGKPKCLPQAKFDFLCVEGALFAGHEPDKRVFVDFMVDSGSDVSTVQEETLESLDLELVGPIYSCGIHGGNHTNLYRAQLQIGHQQMTVEVIASNYDSLGSRIIRHFRHVIDGNRHIWLKGNYKDPLPAILPLKIPVHPSKEQQILSIENDPCSSGHSSNNFSVKTQSHSNSDTTFKVPLPVYSSSNNSTSSHPPRVCDNDRTSPQKVPTNSTRHLQPHNSLKDMNVKSSESVSNSFKDSNSQESCQHIADTVTSDVNTTNILELKAESNSLNCIHAINPQDTKTSSSKGTGVKRPVDRGNELLNDNSCLPKVIKLDNEVLNSSHSTDVISRLSGVCEKERSLQISGHFIPESSLDTSTNIECSHLSRNPSSLLDTDDDVDHMTCGNEEYLPSLSSHPPPSDLHCHSSTTMHFNYSTSLLHEASRNHTDLSSTDVVHVHSDDDDDSGSGCRELSTNFVLGNSTSSVTISIVDLSNDFEITED